LYLAASLRISLLTKGILRSLWSVRLLTYHGASAIARSVFDCYECRILKFLHTSLINLQ
jgi:hypothetical protein